MANFAGDNTCKGQQDHLVLGCYASVAQIRMCNEKFRQIYDCSYVLTGGQSFDTGRLNLTKLCFIDGVGHLCLSYH